MGSYENLGVVGEGSYGIVSRCRHKPTNRIVAIKKFIESEDDKNVRKIALREIRALKKLKHDNLVALLEVFRRKKRLYLVFEFVDRTVLDELERCPNGLSEISIIKIIYQVILAVNYMHSFNFIHRDIKPENILISKAGVVKVCDFGFARSMFFDTENTKNIGSNRTQCTDYVATRWYRAPELLVGDLRYGTGVDIWAIGCLTAELSNSLPLFAGKSDLDQLHLIMMSCGDLCEKHSDIFQKSSSYRKFSRILPKYKIGSVPLERSLGNVSSDVLELIKSCLKMNPVDRWTCEALLSESKAFKKPTFISKYLPELEQRISNASNLNQIKIKEITDSDVKKRKTRKIKNLVATEPIRVKTQESRPSFVKNPSSLSIRTPEPVVKIMPSSSTYEYTHFPALPSKTVYTKKEQGR